MKRVWIPVVGLFLTAVIAAFADSAMQPASATGTITKSKLNNPARKRRPRNPRCCRESRRAPPTWPARS